MHQIHPQARTTPVVRAEIARSMEGTGVLARRIGVSDETVRKWRRRGAEGCTDRSSKPRLLAWKTTEARASLQTPSRKPVRMSIVGEPERIPLRRTVWSSGSTVASQPRFCRSTSHTTRISKSCCMGSITPITCADSGFWAAFRLPPKSPSASGRDHVCVIEAIKL